MSWLAELKRRNVFRIGLAWLALSWLLVAMCALLFPALGLPIDALRWIILGLLTALLPLLLLAWRYEWTPTGFRVDDGSHSPNPQREITARRLNQAIVVLVLGALSLALIRQFIDQARPTPEPLVPQTLAQENQPAARKPPPAPVDPHSMAVLPFINMSEDASNAYFADGLSEELLNVLARIPGLKVTSRTSSFVFRDSKLPLDEIASQLGVAHLLEGSVRRQDEQVRINVQLISRGGEHIWAETYDRRLVEIFRVQEDISQAIADALVDSLGVRQVKVAAPTKDLEAYEWYLRGRQLFAQRGANLPAARDLLERAVAQDAQFADAWAALAGTWYVWPSYSAEPEGIDTMARAEETADRALAIQADHPGALAVSARIAADRGDRLRHRELIEQALALEPSSANSRLWQGLGLFEVGHIEQARESFLLAQRLDPLSGLQLGWLGIASDLRGDRVGARKLLRQAHALGWRGPASRALYFIESSTEGADANQAFLNWLHDDDSIPERQRELARTLAPALSDPTQLASAQQQLLAATQAAPDADWTILLQVFGLTDAAIASALDDETWHSQSAMFSLWYPQFRSFREHPRFMEFARRQGLAAYWDKLGPPDGCQFSGGDQPSLDCGP